MSILSGQALQRPEGAAGHEVRPSGRERWQAGFRKADCCQKWVNEMLLCPRCQGKGQGPGTQVGGMEALGAQTGSLRSRASLFQSSPKEPPQSLCFRMAAATPEPGELNAGPGFFK